MKDLIKRISLTVFLSSLIVQCSSYSNKVLVTDDEKVKSIVEHALSYIIDSKEYLFIFENEPLKPFLVQPKYDYFSFNRAPFTLKDSAIQLGKIEDLEEIESNINSKFFHKKNHELLDLSSAKKSNQIISFTGSDGNYLIATIKFVDQEFTIQDLKNDNWEDDTCQEWLFLFLLEEGKIKEVIHSSRHC